MIKHFYSRIMIVVAVVAICACGSEDSSVAAYNVEAELCNKPFKCSYDIRIQDRLSEQELSKVANKIKDKTPEVDSVFINYYLPCMKIGNGAWASARFSPDLSVTVQDYMLAGNPTCETQGN